MSMMLEDFDYRPESKTIADLQQHLAAAKEQNESLQQLCAAAYQMAGAYEAPVGFLDDLSDAANGRPLRHDPAGLLPVENQWHQQLAAAQEQIAELTTQREDARLERDRWQSFVAEIWKVTSPGEPDQCIATLKKLGAEAAEAKLATLKGMLGDLAKHLAGLPRPKHQVAYECSVTKRMIEQALAQIDAPKATIKESLMVQQAPAVKDSLTTEQSQAATVERELHPDPCEPAVLDLEGKLARLERIARQAINNLSHDKHCPTGRNGNSEECTCLIGHFTKALAQIDASTINPHSRSTFDSFLEEGIQIDAPGDAELGNPESEKRSLGSARITKRVIREVHPLEPEQQQPPQPSDTQRLFKCWRCGQEFATEAEYDAH